MRRYCVTSTPVPIWPTPGSSTGGEETSTASRRVYPSVFAFAMLCALTSSAACDARRPRSAVFSPTQAVALIDRSLCPGVEGLVAGAGDGAPGRGVARLRRVRDGSHQVVEEREL